MEHPMPVGKTFPTNPSIPQKEARSFSIKDEKTPIILSPDEMSPAGKADYDSAKNNQDKEATVRQETFGTRRFSLIPASRNKKKKFSCPPRKKTKPSFAKIRQKRTADASA